MSKTEQCLAMVRAGWASLPDMMATTGWKEKTIRGVLSKSKMQLQRRRVDGVTSYRINPEETQ